jgi:ubiquinone/menaquinone biosynthesis C-methylase UbiE
MVTEIYKGERAQRATGTEYLEKRLEINRAYSLADFDGWLLSRLEVSPGEDILDVGCGTGAQTIPLAKLVGPSGSVTALDISQNSVTLLQSRIPPGLRVQAVCADMGELDRLIKDEFAVKTYSLTHSSYALYYSKKRIDVLDTMRRSLKVAGRCAVFTPNEPHGLVELAARFSSVPREVTNSLRFGPELLEPYFRKHFQRTQVHHFHNVVTVPSADVLIEFYRQTTYYRPEVEPAMRAAVVEAVEQTGRFQYQKNGFLIIGYLN